MSFEEIYDEWAHFYDRLYNSPDDAIEETKATIGRVLLERRDTGSVLEVGCGIGYVAAGLAELGFNVTGIDISQESLKRAEKLLAERDLAGRFLVADILSPPEGLGSFDIVVAVGSFITHFKSYESQARALQSMAGFLRPDGTFLLSLHDYDTALIHDPDDVITSIAVLRRDLGESLVFQRRQWRGQPRSRLHTSTYFFVGSGDDLRTVTMDTRAITSREVERPLRAAGLKEIAWLPPSRTGYYQQICLGRKVTGTESPVEGHLEQEAIAPATEEAKAPAIRRKTLLIWNANLEGIYDLLRLLTETEDDIYVHCVDRKISATDNGGSVGGVEPSSADRAKIKLYIAKHYRYFTCSASAIDQSSFQQPANSAATSMYLAAQAALTYGFRPFDRIILTMDKDLWPAEGLSRDSYKLVFYETLQLGKLIWRSEDFPKLILQPPGQRGREAADYLPDSLLEMIGHKTSPG